MPQGFGDNATDRSLMHSVRRMNALTKVLGKYENDPKGRKKMLKKMKKYYHGWQGELDRIDMKQVEMPAPPTRIEQVKEEEQPELTPEEVKDVKDFLSK
jgi:hypothetical protein|tara:strand:- start:9515 stop:9811 length:297 start_codon:yes stop_codon:yes gene_type:complete